MLSGNFRFNSGVNVIIGRNIVSLKVTSVTSSVTLLISVTIAVHANSVTFWLILCNS